MIELQLIGGGQMGTALIAGILAAKQVKPSQVVIVEPSSVRRAALVGELPDVEVTTEIQSAVNTIIATKPDVVLDVAAQAAHAGTQRILSVAAGISTEAISKAATVVDHSGPVVLRCMPNTPVLVQTGAFGLAAGPGATQQDLDWASTLLSPVGLVVEVEEPQIDAVTGLSGSGPAYFYLVVEALIEGGINAGLSPQDAHALTIQTMYGAALLLREPDADPVALREAVTSPNGTTAAGLRTLEEHDVRAAFTAAVASATQRAQELGQ